MRSTTSERPPFELRFTAEAEKVRADLDGKRHQQKRKRVLRTLKQLEVHGPRRPGLQSHQYQSVRGPGGAQLWESYVENRTPGAWRVWWTYGPEAGQLTIVTNGPHPD